MIVVAGMLIMPNGDTAGARGAALGRLPHFDTITLQID